MAEQWFCKPQVGGSIPLASSSVSRGRIGHCAQIVPGDLLGGIFEVFIRGDVVSVEHRNGSVSRNSHRDHLIHVGSCHVPDGRPPKIVTQGSRESRLPPGSPPSLGEILELVSPVSPTAGIREQVRHRSAKLPLQCRDPVELLHNHQVQFRG